jgi:CheY-like chemotaxis protein
MLPRAATRPAEAVAWLQAGGEFDLALIDTKLAESDGYQLAADIRRLRTAARLPIAVLTAPGEARASAELGICGGTSKPVRPVALRELIEGIISGREVRHVTVATPSTSVAEDHPLAILLAEDNPVNQRVAKLMFQRLGYQIDIVGNGREAVEAVEAREYDLVLMDLQMPEMDGLQAAQEICRRWAAGERPRIVAMTANASTADRAACFGAGMDDFVTKPVRTESLLAALRATPARRDRVAA